MGFQDIFYDVIRQGLPTIGAVGGLIWATADGVARDQKEMVKRGLMGATIGWGLGYVTRWLSLKALDSLTGEPLPTAMASLGPQSKNLGYTEPGTMPNPTYHPEPFVNPADLPQGPHLVGEESQTINITPPEIKRVPPKVPPPTANRKAESVKVEGSLFRDAYGSA